MNIEDLTIKQARELANLFGGKAESNKAHPFKIGENYLIRTVTMALVGKLEQVFDSEFVLSGASWVACIGRFSDAMKSGLEPISESEIEPFVNDAIVGRGALIDMSVYNFPLPKSKK